MSENFIIAAGQTVDIGCPVIKWNEPDGLSFYPHKKFNPRNISFIELQKQISCFVLHHSVTYRAKNTYTGLLVRELSVNFIIDDDDDNGYATIYQCLDIKDAGWSHHPLNNQGPGVEISYQPCAWQDFHTYSEANQQKWKVPIHPIVSDTVHGTTRQVFAPTQAQINSCTALLWGFCELFPTVKRSFTRTNEGNLNKTVATQPQGLLSHFNITTEKMDPAGFPHLEVEAELQTRFKVGF